MTRIAVGSYRTHAEPMQIVSGRIGRRGCPLRGTTSARVPHEMARLIDWFNLGTEPTPWFAPRLAHLVV